MACLPDTAPSVILRKDQQDFFLIDTESGEIFQINFTAARIFELCRARESYETAVKTLATSFSANGQEPEILKDVEETVQKFQELGVCRFSTQR